MLGDPEGLRPEQREALRADLPRIEALCAELAAFGIGPSIQHDDLNDGNVYVHDGAYRIMDWGDACVSHPFHTLTVALRATAWRWGWNPAARKIPAPARRVPRAVRGVRDPRGTRARGRCRLPHRDAWRARSHGRATWPSARPRTGSPTWSRCPTGSDCSSKAARSVLGTRGPATFGGCHSPGSRAPCAAREEGGGPACMNSLRPSR